MPVDRTLMGGPMGPNPKRPIRPSFGVPKKKKPTGGMASPGSGRNRKKLTPKKPNIRKVTGPTPTYKPNIGKVTGKKKIMEQISNEVFSYFDFMCIFFSYFKHLIPFK